MKTYDNSGRLISETTTVVRPEGQVIHAITIYSGDRVAVQQISTRDNPGKVRTDTFLNGKVLP